ncbi:efflux RND transporter periplasmic adaptor subunit [Litoribacillus peritrichatus]|uniref:Efflux RND transporter periplasmic adaptor subunit n=1 Tax=Litoribacillus peritrichatus TaxID=718191 RepID=A0ABP7MMB6_9GAMM
MVSKSTNLQKIILPVLVLSLTAMIIYGLKNFKPEVKRRAQLPEPALQVETVVTELRDYQTLFPSRGLIRPKIESTLAAEVSGTVVAVSEHFRKGARFKEGDWLLTIDPRDYQAEVKLAQANLNQAKLAQEEEQAKSNQALRDWKRLAGTLQNASEPPDLVLRKPQLAAAEAELESAQAQLDKAKLNLERTQIRAPFDGFVLEQSADLGHYLSPGNSVAELAGNVLEVSLPISASWRSMLDWAALQDQSSGARNVALSSEHGQPGTVWSARIVRYSGTVDDQSRQIQLIAEVLPDVGSISQWPLLPGDYVTASIQGKVLSDVIILPRQALIDGSYVWKVVEQRLDKQAVDVVWRDQQVVVVRDGVISGDEINITPLGNVITGTKVEVIPSDQDRDGEDGSVDQNEAVTEVRTSDAQKVAL